jgi:signal transduction histidine kinase
LSFHSSDSGESRPVETDAPRCCAFLCDNDGQVIHDFGEHLPFSSESISARALFGLIESGSLMDFLAAVRTSGSILGWEMRIHYGGSASRLLLHSARTSWGILVFATLTPGLATVRDDQAPVSGVATGSMTESEFRRGQHPDEVTTLEAPARQEEVTTSLLLSTVHDLKNLISSILSSCEYLVGYANEKLDPVQVEMLAGIESSARTLLRLSGRIYDLGRLRWRLALSAGAVAEDESLS